MLFVFLRNCGKLCVVLEVSVVEVVIMNFIWKRCSYFFIYFLSLSINFFQSDSRCTEERILHFSLCSEQ